MEHMTLHCPKCGQALTVAAQTAGLATNCPHCGQRLVVPRLPDQRKISLLAVLSLVFCILTFLPVPVACIVRVIAGLLAIVCAFRARRQFADAPESLRGKWLTLPGVVLVYCLLAMPVLVLFAPPGLVPGTGHMEKPNRINCAANLKQIGLACIMYAGDHEGAFPPDFHALAKDKYLDAPTLYLCPSTNHQPATSAGELSSPKHCDYLYFGKRLVREKVSDPATTVVACDRSGNHKKFWNVVFADGHVMGFSGDDFAAVVRDNHLVLPAESAAKAR